MKPGHPNPVPGALKDGSVARGNCVVALKRNSLDSGLYKTTTKQPLQQSIPPKITNIIQLLDFNKAVQQHASTTRLPTTIPLAPGMVWGLWVGYKVTGPLDRGHQGRVCRHYKHPASDPTHYDNASVNIGVKTKLLAQLLAGSQREHPWFYT
ncbi:hypothetical protein B0H14DRAFT_2587543 [Mycena olivaceomarginata]|nr:hypothetical protein B0H14DRAFT_2587543 [Mycena olivaceomarginata]